MIFRAFLISTLLAGAAAAQAPPAVSAPAPATAALDADAACVLVLAAAVGSMNARSATLDDQGLRQLQMLQYSVHYYAGRIGVRHPGAAAGPVLIATGRALPPAEYPTLGPRCLADYVAGMGAISQEAQAAGPLTREQPAAGAAAADPHIMCFAVLTHTLSIAMQQEAQLTPQLRNALPQLRMSLPFYAGRISLSSAPGTRAPAIATAFRTFQANGQERGAQVIGGCLNGIRDQLGVLASAVNEAQPR